MSHSTIGTSSFLLSKYSRSYPVKRTLQKGQIASQTGPESTPDWQHFTNPTIRLVLDVRATTDAEIQSVKLRILWELNYGIEIGASQQDVVFEDLELLSFSALASGVPRKNQSEGLPLKAVYRDTVVGIRYLHSREDGVPVYRRFQISFQVPSQATEFIEMIKPVCPCKLNPMVLPPPVPSQIPALANRPTLQKNLTSVPSASTLPNRFPSFACPPPSALPVAPQTQNSIRYTTPLPRQNQSITHTSSPLVQHTSSFRMSFHSLDTRSSDHQYSLQNAPMHDHISTAVISSAHPQDISIPGDQALNTTKITTAPNLGHLPSSSLPSLPTPSSSNPATNVSLPERINTADYRTGKQMFQTPSDDQTSVYNMSNSVLERVVGEIIHEEGFIQLVERLSDTLIARTLLPL